MDRFESLLVACMSTPLAVGPAAPYHPTDPWGINLNASGGSGIGKTGRIKALGQFLGLPVFPIFVATKAPEHIGGFPVMTPSGFTLECALPQVRAAIAARRAILHLSEITSATPATQAALLSFVNERTLGEYTLPPGVRIVLDMNPAEIAANGRDLEIPLANRVCHFDYECPSLAQWREYMAGRYNPGVPDAIQSDTVVALNWRTHFDTVLETTGDYLAANGGKIKEKVEGSKEEIVRMKYLDQPSSDDPRASGAWPSPRTWHMAVNGVTAARCLGLGVTTQVDIVAGCVGAGIASEWAAYVKKANLPQPIEVLMWKGGWPIPKALDIVRIVLLACATYVLMEPDRDAQVDLAIRCLDLLLRATQAGYGDLVAWPPYKQLIEAGFSLKHKDARIVSGVEDIGVLLADQKLTKQLLT